MIASTVFADRFTDNYNLVIWDEGSRDWHGKISADIISIDNAIGVISRDVVVPQQNIVVAKSGGNYSSIQNAINSITDEATDKRYNILINPGEYEEQVIVPSYISLIGVDRDSVVITNTANPVVKIENDCILSNLTINQTHTTTNKRGLQVGEGGSGANVLLDNIYVEATVGIAVEFRGVGNLWTTRIQDCVFKGVTPFHKRFAGFMQIFSTKFHIIGQDLSVDHHGIDIEHGARINLYGCDIRTSWDASEEVTGNSDNVYGVNIRTDATSTRVHLYSCSIMVNNDDVADVYGIFSKATAPTVVTRMFGGLLQAESTGGTPINAVQVDNSIIELHNPKLRGTSNELSGNNIRGGYHNTNAIEYNYISQDIISNADIRGGVISIDNVLIISAETTATVGGIVGRIQILSSDGVTKAYLPIYAGS